MLDFNALRERAKDFNITLNDAQIQNFRDYAALLAEYNVHTNLVASADIPTVIAKHFLDSLSLGLFAGEIDFNGKLNIIDIGAGGGFPGVPLIIAFPGWKLCSVDSINKKMGFIRLLADKLGITDRVEALTKRAEELAKTPEKREKFDIVIARAVGRLNLLAEYCLPFVREGGYFVAYKAKLAEEELAEAGNALSILGGKHIETRNYVLPGGEERSLVLIRKIASTSDRYPRNTGIPAKRPL
jgi:16S rRNA (guanine527-N7)-methyltransferase